MAAEKPWTEIARRVHGTVAHLGSGRNQVREALRAHGHTPKMEHFNRRAHLEAADTVVHVGAAGIPTNATAADVLMTRARHTLILCWPLLEPIAVDRVLTTVSAVGPGRGFNTQEVLVADSGPDFAAINQRWFILVVMTSDQDDVHRAQSFRQLFDTSLDDFDGETDTAEMKLTHKIIPSGTASEGVVATGSLDDILD